MAKSIVRSRAMITRAIDRKSWEEIADGAILQEDGIIKAVGTFKELKAANPQVPVFGSGNEIMLPGFVNGHHHIGLTPVQLGSPDMPLELWFITRMVVRNLNLRLDTLYSAFEMIGSGITTVQHIHGWMPGTLPEVQERSNQVIKAYEDIGMRVSYCYAVRDQNRLVYQADEEFIQSLPRELQDPMTNWFGRFKTSLEESMALFRDLHPPTCTGVRIKRSRCFPRHPRNTMRLCTCICLRRRTKRNTRGGGESARRLSISSVSTW
jgi:5-methylthioadenosine/S-adenosylhomocysteine deaminase